MNREIIDPTAQGHREQLVRLGFETIGALTLGETDFLLRQKPTGELVLDVVDNSRDQQYFQKETSILPASSLAKILGVDALQVALLRMTPQPPKIIWHERSTGPDEPTITYETIGALDFNPAKIDLSEGELTDLFIKPTDRKPAAAFFAMDTKKQQVIGIALRRQNPALIFLPPQGDGGQLSTTGGLVVMLNGLYERLSQRFTSLQSEVDDKIFKAMLSSGGQVVIATDNTQTGIRKRDLYKRIYQLQAVLLALKAEKSGKGIKDIELFAHAPFLVENGGRKNLFGRGGMNLVRVDQTIWTNLLEEVKAGLITTPVLARPSIPQARPQERLTSPSPTPVSKRDQVVYQAPPAPRAPEAPKRQLTEKQKAMLLARDVDYGLQEALAMFAQRQPAEIGLRDVVGLNTHLEDVISKAEAYTQERRRGKPPARPTPGIVHARPGTLMVAGIRDQDAYEYLTGMVEDYKQKIESVFEAWEKSILPIYQLTNARSQRMLTALPKAPNLKDQAPEAVHAVTRGLIRILPDRNQLGDIAAAELSHILLSEQALYALAEYYRILKEHGESVEIDNWVAYTYNMMYRLRRLSIQIKGINK